MNVFVALKRSKHFIIIFDETLYRGPLAIFQDKLLTSTYCDEAGEYVAPNVLCPRDLVFTVPPSLPFCQLVIGSKRFSFNNFITVFPIQHIGDQIGSFHKIGQGQPTCRRVSIYINFVDVESRKAGQGKPNLALSI